MVSIAGRLHTELRDKEVTVPLINKTEAKPRSRSCVDARPEQTYLTYGLQPGDRGRTPPPAPVAAPFIPALRADIASTRNLLARAHDAAQPRLRAAFGSTAAIPYNCRHILSTVTVAEAHFLADYLEIPRQNVLQFKARKLARGSTTAATAAVRAYLAQHPHLEAGDSAPCSLTLLGHMFARDGEPRFARLPVARLFAALEPLQPRHLNLFSCNSDSYHRALAGRFAAAAAAPVGGACFRDGVEVSPLFERDALGHRLPTLFYAGPELGPGAHTRPHLWAGLHRPVLPQLMENCVDACLKKSSAPRKRLDAAPWPPP